MKHLFFTLSFLLLSLTGFSQTPVFGVLFINDTPGSYDQNGYIVTNGGQLFMAPGTYSFNPGRGIEVATNGYLQLDGPHLTMKCNSTNPSDYWAGVTAYGAPVTYSTGNTMAENWGIVSKHNLIIEKAETGLYMRYELGNYNGLTNSVDIVGNGYARSILTYNGTNTCKFSENRKYDIRIHNNVNTENYSASGNTPSSTWQNYYFQSSSPDFVISMEINNTNMMKNIGNFEIHSPNQGIYLNNSNFNIADSRIYASSTIYSAGIIHRISNNNLMTTVIKSSEIKAYKYGVYSRESEGIYIGDNSIIAVDYSVFTKQTENAQVMYNKLLYSKYGYEANMCETTSVHGNTCVDNGAMSVYVNQCNDIKLQGNHIAWNSASVLSDEGIYIYNSTDTRVIRNQFKRAVRQLSYHGLNPQVKIHCNTFRDPSAPIYAAISVFNNPINDQGNSTDGGANNYFLLPSSTFRVRNNLTPTLTFTNSMFIPSTPSINTTFAIDPTYNANCNVPKMAQDIEVESENITPVPNPFTDVLTLGENVNKVQIYAISGQHIQTIHVESTEINLGHLDAGTYFMMVESKNGNTSRHKMIKQ